MSDVLSHSKLLCCHLVTENEMSVANPSVPDLYYIRRPTCFKEGRPKSQHEQQQDDISVAVGSVPDPKLNIVPK